ncbi:MAG: amidase, partial [Myxococcota bacterium]|nr:amidase [Myxococcota bacterium]
MGVPENEGWFRSSALRLAERLRAGELTSSELVEEHIAFIQRVNPTLNAVVHDRFEQARAEAREADARLAGGGEDLPPFLGVPCTIKECIAFEGMPWTSGLVARRGLVAHRDAPVVERIRRAGAIPLGVTNISELCMWMESNNHVYGRTSNPYNPAHIVGGSSGGEGAIVGSGAVPFGIGSDIGGSIRLPSFFNGIFGHKATSRMVPVTGQYPPAENDARLMLSAGPMTRRAEDLMPLLRIIAGPDGEDQVTVEQPLGDPGEISMRGLKVMSVTSNGLLRVSSDLRQAQGRAAATLSRLGCEVTEGRIRGLRRSFQVWSQRMSSAADTPFRTHLGEGTPISVGGELARWAVGRSVHTLPALALAVLEALPGVDTDDAEPVRADIKRL